MHRVGEVRGFIERLMQGETTPLLELRNVSKSFRGRASLFGRARGKVVALEDISFGILYKEIFGLVGESGSGKTTAGKLITRLEHLDKGEIYLDGSEISPLRGRALKDFHRRIQMIFQDPYQSLNPQLSVFDIVSEPLKIHGIGSREEKEEYVGEALSAAGLSPPEDFLFRYPHQLSGGQRQRVAIARAMVIRPRFVVADEPTSMLDASISAHVFNILLRMRREMDATLLFITHSLAAARYLCDRIAVIYRGHLVEMGFSEEVIKDPKHPYTQALLDALPRFGAKEEVKYYDTLLEDERGGYEGTGCPFFPRCKLAHRMKCAREKPPLADVSPSRLVACFYA